jgi:hypothetical protein
VKNRAGLLLTSRAFVQNVLQEDNGGENRCFNGMLSGPAVIITYRIESHYSTEFVCFSICSLPLQPSSSSHNSFQKSYVMYYTWDNQARDWALSNNNNTLQLRGGNTVAVWLRKPTVQASHRRGIRRRAPASVASGSFFSTRNQLGSSPATSYGGLCAPHYLSHFRGWYPGRDDPQNTQNKWMDRLFHSRRLPVASLAIDINNKIWSRPLTTTRRRKYPAHDIEALLPELHCPVLDCGHDLDLGPPPRFAATVPTPCSRDAMTRRQSRTDDLKKMQQRASA